MSLLPRVSPFRTQSFLRVTSGVAGLSGLQARAPGVLWENPSHPLLSLPQDQSQEGKGLGGEGGRRDSNPVRGQAGVLPCFTVGVWETKA